MFVLFTLPIHGRKTNSYRIEYRLWKFFFWPLQKQNDAKVHRNLSVSVCHYPVAVRGDFDNRGKLVWYPVWWARGSGGALKAPPTGPGPKKKTGISTFLKFSMLLRLLGQQFHYTVHCNIGGNSRVVENNGLISMLFPIMQLNTSL